MDACLSRRQYKDSRCRDIAARPVIYTGSHLLHVVQGLNIFHYAFLKPANSFVVQDDKAHKATQSGPKLEIKVDAEGTAALVTVPDEEHSKSCNLSPLTPKCAPCHHRMALQPGLKSGRMQEYHIRNDEDSPLHVIRW
jgi:hypothetical protein